MEVPNKVVVVVVVVDTNSSMRWSYGGIIHVRIVLRKVFGSNSDRFLDNLSRNHDKRQF